MSNTSTTTTSAPPHPHNLHLHPPPPHQAWARAAAEKFGYEVSFEGVGKAVKEAEVRRSEGLQSRKAQSNLPNPTAAAGVPTSHWLPCCISPRLPSFKPRSELTSIFRCFLLMVRVTLVATRRRLVWLYVVSMQGALRARSGAGSRGSRPRPSHTGARRSP